MRMAKHIDPKTDPWTLADQLAQLGQARQRDLDRGGEPWAEFNDWCWSEGRLTTREALEEWTDGQRLSAKTVTHLRELVAEVTS